MLPVPMSPQRAILFPLHAPTPALPGEFAVIPLGTSDPRGPVWIFPEQPLPFLMPFPTPLLCCPPRRRLSHTPLPPTPWQPDPGQPQPSGGSGTKSSTPDGSLNPDPFSSQSPFCWRIPLALPSADLEVGPFLLILPGTCCLDQCSRLLTSACFCP